MVDATQRRSSGGRPRDPGADVAILEAARGLLGEFGYDRLTIEGVAERAGVAKTTIYRRFPSKVELVTAAIDELRPPGLFPDTGSLASDLDAFLAAAEQGLRDPLAMRIIAALFGSIGQDDGLFDTYWRGYVEPRRASFRELFTRAQARGELRDDLDLEQFIDLVGGVVMYQAVRPSDRPVASRVRDGLEFVWAGVTPDGRSPFADATSDRMTRT